MLLGARQTVHVSVRFSRSAGARLLSTGRADMRWLGTFRCSNTGAHRSRSTTHVETIHHTSRLFASSGASDDRQLLVLLACTGYGNVKRYYKLEPSETHRRSQGVQWVHVHPRARKMGRGLNLWG